MKIMPSTVARTDAERGSSLVEALIATALLSLLMGGAYTVLFHSQAIFEKQLSTQALRQESRVAVNQMISELRLAGYGLGTAPDALTAGSSTSITFVADVDDGDAGGACNSTYETAPGGGAERITYTLQSGQLQRSVDCWDGSTWTTTLSGQLWATDLPGEQTVFRYFDASGVELVPTVTLSDAQRAQVRAMEIVLRLQETDKTQITGEDHADFDLETRIKLRNLGS